MRQIPLSRRPESLRILCESAPQYGVTAEHCLSGTGLRLEELYNPDTKLSVAQELAAIENFLTHAPKRDGLGIEIGRRIKLEVLGIWGYAILTSPTLRVSIATAIKFYELSFVIAPMTLSEYDDEGCVTFDISVLPKAVRKFVLERHLTVLVNFADAISPEISPAQFRFRTTEFTPEFAKAIQTQLGISVLPDPEVNSVVIPRNLLDRPLPQHNPEVLAVCLEQCANLQRQGAQNTWSARVHNAILAELQASPSLQTVALSLRISDRTLTRRLAEEGTTFRALSLKARLAVARELLATTPLSVASVARHSGYAEPSSFIRAFKKEYGISPGQMARSDPAAL